MAQKRSYEYRGATGSVSTVKRIFSEASVGVKINGYFSKYDYSGLISLLKDQSMKEVIREFALRRGLDPFKVIFYSDREPLYCLSSDRCNWIELGHATERECRRAFMDPGDLNQLLGEMILDGEMPLVQFDYTVTVR